LDTTSRRECVSVASQNPNLVDATIAEYLRRQESEQRRYSNSRKGRQHGRLYHESAQCLQPDAQPGGECLADIWHASPAPTNRTGAGAAIKGPRLGRVRLADIVCSLPTPTPPICALLPSASSAPDHPLSTRISYALLHFRMFPIGLGALFAILGWRDLLR
jgi:hypothetical protein